MASRIPIVTDFRIVKSNSFQELCFPVMTQGPFSGKFHFNNDDLLDNISPRKGIDLEILAYAKHEAWLEIVVVAHQVVHVKGNPKTEFEILKKAALWGPSI